MEELQSKLQNQFFPAGTWIAREGEVGDCMMFIADGAVELVSPASDKVHDTLHAGDFFGEMAVLFRERRTLSVRAKLATAVFKLLAKDLSQALVSYPQVKGAMMAIAQQRRMPRLLNTRGVSSFND